MRTASIALFAGIVGWAFVQPTLAEKATKYQEAVVYSFCSQQNCMDGRYPASSLIDVNGLVYGTTQEGGGAGCNGSGCGTVFSIDPSTGAETVLYSFCGKNNCEDGANPTSSLIAVHGILYGTTIAGGKYSSMICTSGCGTVFSLDPSSGAEKVLYSFCRQANCADGAYPFTSLIDVNGVLYGTTSGGGATTCNDGCGTVFSLDPHARSHKVVYSFCSQTNCADGQWPHASLLAANGMLYGTTEEGGLTGCGNDTTCGTVFAIDLSTGNERVLYSFCSQTNCSDGALPSANLIDVKGALFGTTSFGGVYNCQNMPPGCGTAFALDTGTGAETVLHPFGSGLDGYHSGTGLIDAKGTLYGTTDAGGSAHAGTAFALDPKTSTETVIWSFCGTNCSSPSSLIDVGGKLYGTMELGGTGEGCGSSGCGTVFVIEKNR